ERKIRQGVEQSATRLKTDLKKDGVSDLVIELTIDTFRIQQFMEQYMAIDYSTAGMRGASHEAADRYDSLLNKYYKKLAAVLAPEDRKVLVQAQKAWITYRDSELKLVGVVSKDEYSGGGTVQQLIDSSYYLEIIKSRTIDIYDHLLRAAQTY
ncbi:MAG TPA: lysozyme inhibitor LprI family protein, partial [Chitinophagaceae bacterium]